MVLGCAVVAWSCAQRVNTADAGVDSSCGIDCSGQRQVGLLTGMCFEYSDATTRSSPPALGVIVRPADTLEGNVPVIPVQYRESGLLRMTDYFTWNGGSLRLVRRDFGAGGSVTYKNAAGDLVGVQWIDGTPTSDDAFSTDVTADSFSSTGSRSQVATAYRVTNLAATSGDLLTPLMTYTSGVQLVYSGSSAQGLDFTRTLVPGTGFVGFSSALSMDVTAPSRNFRLQRVVDFNLADAGDPLDCGI